MRRVPLSALSIAVVDGHIYALVKEGEILSWGNVCPSAYEAKPLLFPNTRAIEQTRRIFVRSPGMKGSAPIEKSCKKFGVEPFSASQPHS